MSAIIHGMRKNLPTAPNEEAALLQWRRCRSHSNHTYYCGVLQL